MVRQLQEATQLLQLQRQCQQQPQQQQQQSHQQQQQQQRQQQWQQLGHMRADGGCGPAPPLDRGNQAAADPLGTLGGLGRPPWGNPSVFEASAGFLGQPPAYVLPLGSMGPTAAAALAGGGSADSSGYFRALGRGGAAVGPSWAQSVVEPAAVPPPYAPLSLIGNVGLVPAGGGQRAADTDWRHPGGGALSSSLLARAEHLCPQQRDPRAVITANDFRLLTDGLEQAEVIGHGLMILRNCASLPLRALVAEQLRVSWEVFDERARAPPPRFLGNALLLAAVRDLEARGDLRVVPPDSPLLKKGKLLGQVGTQGGGRW